MSASGELSSHGVSCGCCFQETLKTRIRGVLGEANLQGSILSEISPRMESKATTPCGGVDDVVCTSNNLFCADRKCIDQQNSQELVLWRRQVPLAVKRLTLNNQIFILAVQKWLRCCCFFLNPPPPVLMMNQFNF